MIAELLEVKIKADDSELDSSLKNLEKRLSGLDAVGDKVFKNITRQLEGTLTRLAEGNFGSLGDELKRLYRNTASGLGRDMYINAVKSAGMGNIEKVFASLLGGFFGGARALGGPVSSGKAYMVGERGSEMFIPQQNGYIMPHERRISLNVSLNGNFASQARPSRAQAAAELAAALRKGSKYL